MSPGDDESNGRVGARLISTALAVAALAVALFYADRLFVSLPLYAADEGSYLIHALYGRQLAADPTLAPDVLPRSNTVYLLTIRAATYATQHLLEWLRILGAGAYFGGLLLAWWATRRSLGAGGGTGFLLLALAFPYYRFIVTALPEGLYVGLLGVLVLATAKLYRTRPAVHALLAGGLTAALTLTKPHGLALAAAVLALAAIDAIVGRRDARLFAVQALLFVATFLAIGNLVQFAANQPVTDPFAFFLFRDYGRALNGPTFWSGYLVGLKSLALTTSSTILLAGVPIATGLSRIVARWRSSRGRSGYRLDSSELTFLLVLLGTAATLAMVAIFSIKALVFGATESNRLWGRYFEFFVPLLWLTAAPFIGEFERGAGKTWRVAMALTPLFGLAGLSAFLWTDVMLFPWDATALSAFFVPDLTMFGLDPVTPYFALATIATVAAATATACTSWRTHRIWLAYFVTLGVLSTGFDRGWLRAIAEDRRQLTAETLVVDALVSRTPGAVALVAHDPNAANIAFWRLRARAHMILVPPGSDIAAERLTQYDTVVVAGPHDLGGGWRPAFEGRQLAVLRREARPAPAARLGLPPGTR